MTQGVTTQQDRLLTYLRSCDHSPTYREMQAALKLSSVSRIVGLIDNLEARGFIERLPNQARGIRVIENPKPWFDSLSDEPTSALVAEVRRRGYTVEARA